MLPAASSYRRQRRLLFLRGVALTGGVCGAERTRGCCASSWREGDLGGEQQTACESGEVRAAQTRTRDRRLFRGVAGAHGERNTSHRRARQTVFLSTEHFKEVDAAPRPSLLFVRSTGSQVFLPPPTHDVSHFAGAWCRRLGLLDGKPKSRRETTSQ